jgi:putative membrane protein
MIELAWHNGGPGPWILLVPLLWVVVIATVVTVVRRTVWRRGGPWNGPWNGGPWGGAWRGSWQQRGPASSEHSPMAVLGRRFASGEIDEEEYWRRMSVLEEHFARGPGERKGGSPS